MATCNGCKTAADESRSIRLPGGWSLNHYGGDEGFFGWLALQPIEHRLTLRDLSEVEAAALGPNLGRLEQGIYGYWQSAGQPADRVYAMYFLESQLESGHSWHLHIHVVPRFRCLAELMPLSDGGIDAYCIAKLSDKLPVELDRAAFAKKNGTPARYARDLDIVRGVVAASGFTP